MWYLGFSPRRHTQLRWSDKNLNIRKELTDERVEWRRVIYQEKYNYKECDPSGGQAL